MKTCPNCGAMIDDQAKFCTYCGANVPDGGIKEGFSDKVDEVVNSFENIPDHSGEFDPADIQQNKTISLLSYLGFLFLIPWFARPQSKFARFHVNQGIVLFLAGVVVRLVRGIVNSIFDSSALGLLFSVVNIALFVLMIIGIVNAVNGRAKELPVIGKLRFLKY